MLDKGESKIFDGETLYRWINVDGSRGGWVSGNARVSDTACVSGNARVTGNAWVTGNARVTGGVWDSSPLYIKGTCHAATNCAYGHIAIGCEVHDFEVWLRCYHDIGVQHGYTPEQIAEYKKIIDFIVANGK